MSTAETMNKEGDINCHQNIMNKEGIRTMVSWLISSWI